MVKIRSGKASFAVPAPPAIREMRLAYTQLLRDVAGGSGQKRLI
jgi:hypothetical protein